MQGFGEVHCRESGLTSSELTSLAGNTIPIPVIGSVMFAVLGVAGVPALGSDTTTDEPSSLAVAACPGDAHHSSPPLPSPVYRMQIDSRLVFKTTLITWSGLSQATCDT